MLDKAPNRIWKTSAKIDRIIDELSMAVDMSKEPFLEEAVSHVQWAIFQLRLASECFFKQSSKKRRETYAKTKT